MKTNRELQDAVIDELRWEPRVDASAIGVSAIAGSVTLTGHASSYAQKLDAVRAAERVDGVTAVADELEVHLSGDPRDDADVAKALADALKWASTFERNADLDADGISVKVSDGTIELSGQVHSLHEANIAESAAWSAPGVQSVERHLTVTP